MTERTGDGGAFCGLTLGARLTRADLADAKRPKRKATAAAANGAGAGKVTGV